MSPVSPLSVLHVASHEINVGDGALIGVIQDRLRRAASGPVDIRNLDIVELEPEYGERGLQPAELEAHDLVLVGGGGTIDNRRTRTDSGMAFPLSGRAIRELDTSLAYVAVGYNLFGGTRLRNADALADVLRACEERGFPFSVRNDGSLARLRDAVGDAARSVAEIPDPGFFVEVDRSLEPPAFSGHRPRVLVQVAADNPGYRFGRGGDLIGRIRNHLPFGLGSGLTSGLAGVVEWLVEEHDAEVILAPHITPDLALVAGILERLPTAVARKRTRVLGVAHPSRASDFFAAYAGADLVLGMRGHAVICAAGLRVPVVGLSSHPKVRGFMEACDLGPWVAEYGPGFDRALRPLVTELLSDPSDHLARRDAATSGFSGRLDAFMARCWGLSGG